MGERKMEVMCVKIPPGCGYGDKHEPAESDELGSYNMDDLKNIGVTKAAYWYESGYYDGTGYIVYYANGGWHESSLGHCSCNGPTDDLGNKNGVATLDELEAKCSPELRRNLSTIIAALREKQD